MIAFTTKHTLKEILNFLIFAILSLKLIEQIKKYYGLVTIKIRIRDLRTLTVWQNIEDLQAFWNSGVHLKAMKNSNKLRLNQTCTWQTDYIPSCTRSYK